MSRKCAFHVLHCDSSDKAHPVQSITKNDPASYWQTASATKETSVTIEFDKPCIIDAFELVNAGSAFLEVRLIEAGGKEEILLLLSPAEAKDSNSSGKFRRKNISHALLSPSSAKVAHKLRIICTQPFSEIPIGLKSFIVFGDLPMPQAPSSPSPSPPLHSSPSRTSPDKKSGTHSSGASLTTLLMDEDEALQANKSGFLFFEKKAKGDKILREERKPVAAAIPTPGPHIPPPLPLTADAKPPPKTSPKPRAKPAAAGKSEKKEEKKEEKKDAEMKRSLSLEDTITDTKKHKTESAQSPGSGKKPLNKAMSVQLPPPLSRILEGVVLVISGIENPERAKLRDLAMQMGATYRPQWDRESTHLVAEFAETPKVREAQQSHGIIVTASWLKDCYSHKKRLPAENYKLGPRRGGLPLAQTFPDDSDDILPDISPKKKPKKEEIAGDDTDPDDFLADEKTKAMDDDELQRRWYAFSGKGRAKEPKKAANIPVPAASSGASMGKKAPAAQRYLSMGSLENFLSGVKIYLFGDFDAAEKKALRRYAAAYDGDVIDDVEDATHIIVANPSLKAPPKKGAGVPMLKPAWLHKCHEEQRRVPERNFQL